MALIPFDIGKGYIGCFLKSDCKCLEEMPLFNFHGENYSQNSKKHVEMFLIQCQKHYEKEYFSQNLIPMEVSAYLVRWNLIFLKETVSRFEAYISNIKNVFIDFPGKSISLLNYIQHVKNYHKFVDNMVEISMYPYSKISVFQLKNILEIHLELLMIFEQFVNLLAVGYSHSVKSNYGIVNLYNLFYK